MITITAILENNNLDPQRLLSLEEKLTVTSSLCNGVEYIYYQGDEPDTIEQLVEESIEENKLEAIEVVKERFEETLKTRVFQSSLGFSVQNRRFGINNDLQNIDSLISVNVPFFMDADNIQQPVTLVNLQTIKSEMIVDGLNLYQSKFDTIDEINECTTNAQIWAIIG